MWINYDMAMIFFHMRTLTPLCVGLYHTTPSLFIVPSVAFLTTDEFHFQPSSIWYN